MTPLSLTKSTKQAAQLATGWIFVASWAGHRQGTLELDGEKRKKKRRKTVKITRKFGRQSAGFIFLTIQRMKYIITDYNK